MLAKSPPSVSNTTWSRSSSWSHHWNWNFRRVWQCCVRPASKWATKRISPHQMRNCSVVWWRPNTTPTSTFWTNSRWPFGHSTRCPILIIRYVRPSPTICHAAFTHLSSSVLFTEMVQLLRHVHAWRGNSVRRTAYPRPRVPYRTRETPCHRHIENRRIHRSLPVWLSTTRWWRHWHGACRHVVPRLGQHPQDIDVPTRSKAHHALNSR